MSKAEIAEVIKTLEEALYENGQAVVGNDSHAKVARLVLSAIDALEKVRNSP